MHDFSRNEFTTGMPPCAEEIVHVPCFSGALPRGYYHRWADQSCTLRLFKISSWDSEARISSSSNAVLLSRSPASMVSFTFPVPSWIETTHNINQYG